MNYQLKSHSDHPSRRKMVLALAKGRRFNKDQVSSDSTTGEDSYCSSCSGSEYIDFEGQDGVSFQGVPVFSGELTDGSSSLLNQREEEEEMVFQDCDDSTVFTDYSTVASTVAADVQSGEIALWLSKLSLGKGKPTSRSRKARPPKLHKPVLSTIKDQNDESDEDGSYDSCGSSLASSEVRQEVSFWMSRLGDSPVQPASVISKPAPTEDSDVSDSDVSDSDSDSDGSQEFDDDYHSQQEEPQSDKPSTTSRTQATHGVRIEDYFDKSSVSSLQSSGTFWETQLTPQLNTQIQSPIVTKEMAMHYKSPSEAATEPESMSVSPSHSSARDGKDGDSRARGGTSLQQRSKPASPIPNPFHIAMQIFGGSKTPTPPSKETSPSQSEAHDDDDDDYSDSASGSDASDSASGSDASDSFDASDDESEAELNDVPALSTPPLSHQVPHPVAVNITAKQSEPKATIRQLFDPVTQASVQVPSGSTAKPPRPPQVPQVPQLPNDLLKGQRPSQPKSGQFQNLTAEGSSTPPRHPIGLPSPMTTPSEQLNVSSSYPSDDQSSEASSHGDDDDYSSSGGSGDSTYESTSSYCSDDSLGGEESEGEDGTEMQESIYNKQGGLFDPIMTPNLPVKRKLAAPARGTKGAVARPTLFEPTPSTPDDTPVMRPEGAVARSTLLEPTPSTPDATPVMRTPIFRPTMPDSDKVMPVPGDVEEEVEYPDMSQHFEFIEDPELKRLCTKLHKKLNIDPWDEVKQVKDDYVCDLIQDHPETCSVQYFYNHFNERLFPLSMLCAVRASANTVNAAYDACKGAAEQCDSWIGTPLHYACAYKAPLEVVEMLIQRKPTMMNKTNDLGRTPLHMACLFKTGMGTINLLVKKFPQVLNVKDRIGCTPLHLAAENGASTGVVDALVRASRSSCTARTNSNMTPLHLACKGHASRSVVKTLMDADHLSTMAVDDNGRTPLHMAAQFGAPLATVQILIKANPNLVEETTHRGETPLDLAKKHSAPANVIKFLR